MYALIITSLYLCVVLSVGSLGELSNSGVVSVCVREHLDIVCARIGLTRNDFMDWNVTIIQDSGSRLSDSRLISAAGQSVIRPITLNMINFSINSTTTEAANGSITLTTFMSVSNVTSLLNGTEITCSVVSLPSNIEVITASATVTIYVIKSDFRSVNALELNSTVTKFGPDSVMVTVAWQQERGASYNVSVLPQVVVNMSGPTTLQLTLAYNTLYYVTIATIVCGQTLSTTVTQLHYVKCVNLLQQFEDSSIRVTGYSDPALEGTNVTFQCVSPGLSFFLDGPNSSVCKANGQWEPDPWEVKCLVDCGVPSPIANSTTNLQYNSTLKGSMFEFWCERINGTLLALCLQNGEWSPKPSDSMLCTIESKKESKVSVLSYVYIAIIVILTIALFTSVITNICLCLKCKLSTKTSHDQESAVDLSQTTQPIYETAVAVVETTTQEEEVDMEKNVAYAPITSSRV